MSKALAELRAVIAGDTEVADKVIGKRPETAEARLAALDSVCATLNKKFETTHSLIKLGNKVGKPLPSIPTNMPTFDKETIQCGGIPRGRIIEVFGPESGGKTTFCLHLIAQEQKLGGVAAFVDAEHALDPTWAYKNGVNVDELWVSQPDSGEQALETVEELIRSRAVTLVIVDSVAALVPQAELDGDMGDSHMGLQARMMSQAMRKLRAIAAQTGITVIFINQIREKIGVMFGSPETTSGGRALKFYASVRIDVRRVGQIKDGDEIVGHRTKLKLVKNKVGSPFKEMELDLMYDHGIDIFGDWLDNAEKNGVVERSGAWYSFKTERIGQGRNNAKAFLKDNPDTLAKIKAELDKI